MARQMERAMVTSDKVENENESALEYSKRRTGVDASVSKVNVEHPLLVGSTKDDLLKPSTSSTKTATLTTAARQRAAEPST